MSLVGLEEGARGGPQTHSQSESGWVVAAMGIIVALIAAAVGIAAAISR